MFELKNHRTFRYSVVVSKKYILLEIRMFYQWIVKLFYFKELRFLKSSLFYLRNRNKASNDAGYC